MWQEVYYKKIDEYDLGIGEKHLPYSIKCKDLDEFKFLTKHIGRRGYKCVEKIEGQYAVLVNNELKRWCTYPKPAKMSCVNDRILTVEEFLSLI